MRTKNKKEEDEEEGEPHTTSIAVSLGYSARDHQENTSCLLIDIKKAQCPAVDND